VIIQRLEMIFITMIISFTMGISAESEKSNKQLFDEVV